MARTGSGTPVTLGSGARQLGRETNVTQGLGSTNYYFDEGDELIGITNTNDVVVTCDDGHQAHYTVAGTMCEVTGTGEDLCDDGARCDLKDVCDRSASAFIDCPTGLAGFEPRCDEGFYTRQLNNACGGTIIEVGDGVQAQRFTFDEEGALVGTTWSGDDNHDECWGDPCEPRGTLKNLCLGVGGAGGEGGAGQAGADAGGAWRSRGRGRRPLRAGESARGRSVTAALTGRHGFVRARTQ